MKSAKPSIKVTAHNIVPAKPVRVALKIQRRRYGKDALGEIGIHHLLQREKGACPELVGFHEAFYHDGHICAAYELHGRSMDNAIENGLLPFESVRRIARQLLSGLARMHECGFAHTDIKPMNILYRRTPSPFAKLSDLGNADREMRQGSNRCTRVYTPPEVILGTPLDVRMDMWSLACTLFEIATGRELFDPHKAAQKKYAEFNQRQPEEAYDPSVAQDDAEEEAEQYPAGTLVAKKYLLESILGQGKFATVWRAVMVSNQRLDGAFETLLGHCETDELKRRESAPQKAALDATETAARLWRRERGARDLHDLVLNYEQLLLMQELIGPPPGQWASQGVYASAYCDGEGRLKHDLHSTQTIRLEERLCLAKLTASKAAELSAFLRPLLSWDPASRPTAMEHLDHPFLLAERTRKKIGGMPHLPTRGAQATPRSPIKNRKP